MTFDSRQVMALVLRMQGDFLESPALRLTIDQAERRFGVGRVVCEAVLDALVDSGVLARADDGRYVRFYPRLAHAA
jgi:hypothetical protein